MKTKLIKKPETKQKNKWTTVLFVAILCVSIVYIIWSGSAQAAGNIEVWVNGSALVMDVPPRLEDNRTLIPLRACAEALDAQVDYDAATSRITIQNNRLLLIMTLNSRHAALNGSAILLDVPAKTYNGRTLVPLRFVGEAFQAQVNWIGSLNMVQITTSPQTELGTITGDRTQETKFLELCNEARAAEGLEPLVWVEELSQMGRRQCKDMGTNDFFSHQSASFGNTAQRASRAGLPPVAENIAAGYGNVQEVFDAWMASSEHRANIMNPLCHFLGVGIWQREDGTWYAAAEFVNSRAFLIKSRPLITGANSVTIKGYSLDSQAQLCLYYLMNNDNSRYSAKRSISAVTEEHVFNATVTLDQVGSYALQADEDILYMVRQ